MDKFLLIALIIIIVLILTYKKKPTLSVATIIIDNVDSDNCCHYVIDEQYKYQHNPNYTYVSPDMLLGRVAGRINIPVRRRN